MSMRASRKDFGFIDVSIDGAEMPAGMINAMRSVEIIENAMFSFPLCRMLLDDNPNAFQSEAALTDDNVVTICMGRDESQDLPTSKFRIGKHKAKPSGEGNIVQFVGTLDAPVLTKATKVGAYEGTSSEVLKKVLKEAGVTAGEQWDSTTDKMVWRNPGLSYSSFLNRIAAHSWKTESGLMRLAINEDATATYVDVMDVLAGEPVASVIYGDARLNDKDYAAQELHFGADSNLAAAWVGYGYAVRNSTLDGKVQKVDSVVLDTDAPFLPVNKDSYDTVGAVRNDYAPQECGNTHDEYWRAYAANVRKGSLFTQKAVCLIYGYTGIKLLDCVDLSIINMITDGKREDPINESRGGKYLVTAKKRMWRAGEYAELFELRRIAVNLSGETTLVSDPTTKGSPTFVDEPKQDKAGKSEWTYETEGRKDDPKAHCRDIVEEECMPTADDSTEWDDVEDWTDSNSTRKGGPYEWALTEKRGEVKSRERDTDPPPR